MDIKSNIPENKYDTLVKILSFRAQERPDFEVYHFLKGGEDISKSLTFSELDRLAKSIAVTLSKEIAPGDRAVLLYPSGLEFLSTFFGCLYQGTIGVPVQLHGFSRLLDSIPKILNIADSAGARVILTTAMMIDKLERLSDQIPEIKNYVWLATDTLDDSLHSDFTAPVVEPKTIAYLQFTSGSTSEPKGVALTHQNLIENMACFDNGWGHNENSRMVTWMPHFHDLGLIYGMLQGIYNGFATYIMSPIVFIQQPFRWLSAISRYQGTHTMAPNFAYDLCQRKVTDKQLATLDLSHWQVAQNAAETVREQTLTAFSERFASAGFQKHTFCIAYGLAEATCEVTSTSRGKPINIVHADPTHLEQGLVVDKKPHKDLPVRAIVSCGTPEPGVEVKIVQPETSHECADNYIGEIWIRGAIVSQGYWARPELTEATFNSQIKNSHGKHRYLNTGDLGFMRDGELYMTGRRKDLIIINGENHYPQDIEWTVDKSHPMLRAGGCAAFSLTHNEEEKVVVVQEVERHCKDSHHTEILKNIREHVSSEHNVDVFAVSLIKPGTLLKTTSGKVQRSANRTAFESCRHKEVTRWCTINNEPENTPAESSAKNTDRRPSLSQEKQHTLVSWLKSQVAELTGLSLSQIHTRETFSSYGLGSKALVGLSGDLENWVEQNISPTFFYDYPTIEKASAYLLSEQPPIEAADTTRHSDTKHTHAIAMRGMACQFPGAQNLSEFWNLIIKGDTAISEKDGQPGGYIDNIDHFDAAFFNITPMEAEKMDPQQRLLLEQTWRALEHAAIKPHQLAGTNTGVFVGISAFDYAKFMSQQQKDIEAHATTGGAHSIAANRLSYFLDLNGPSLTVDTACSSSLVAVHLAAQSLRNKECDLAIVAGVNMIRDTATFQSLNDAGMLSTDGRCHTFDAQANGYVRGEGCGVVILQRMADYEPSHGNIMGKIIASAVNQDGRSNGITAPNKHAQTALIKKAIENGNINTSDIDFLETHGTGTQLGDPIEISAIQDAFGSSPLALGSVKANIGHLEAAAGIAGLIKAALCLQHQQIPKLAGFKSLNPYINLDNSHISIPITTQSWQTPKRCAAINSFSFGGTNAHVILENHKKSNDEVVSDAFLPNYCFLSAHSPEALDKVKQALLSFIESNPAVSADALLFTQNATRTSHPYRFAMQAKTRLQLKNQLVNNTGLESSNIKATEKSIAFVFTGQGAQFPGMGKSLYKEIPYIQRFFDHAHQTLKEKFNLPHLLDVLVGEDNDNHLSLSVYTQASLYIFEVALANWLTTLNIQANMTFGHSLGEYSAATYAGCLDFETGLSLVIHRAQMADKLCTGGRMAVVLAKADTIAPLLAPGTVISAFNGPHSATISGSNESVIKTCEILHNANIETRELAVNCGFHSSEIAPAALALKNFSKAQIFHAPRIPLLSNGTGDILNSAPTAEYWCEHMLEPVQFQKCVETAKTQGCTVFIEIGPKATLTQLIDDCLDHTSTETNTETHSHTNSQVIQTISLTKKNQSFRDSFSHALAQCFVSGLALELTPIYKYHKIPLLDLPPYPFTRKSYWISELSSATLSNNTHTTVSFNDTTEAARKVQSNTLSKNQIVENSIAHEIRQLIIRLLKVEADAFNDATTFFELGADSIMLVRMIQTLEEKYQVEVSVRQVFEQLNSIQSLSRYLAETTPVAMEEYATIEVAEDNTQAPESISTSISTHRESFEAQKPANDNGAPPKLRSDTAAPITDNPSDLFTQQLNLVSDVIRQQINALQSHSTGNVTHQPPSETTTKKPAPENEKKKSTLPPWKPRLDDNPIYTQQQKGYLNQWIKSFNQQNTKSKTYAADNRATLADNRAVAGFRLATKEMLYPLVVDKSEGSRLWDIDGNEYIDLAMGFGADLFGHNPEFIREAISQQIAQGIQLGPQSPLVGEVAQLIHKITGLQRVAFCNTGTDSVMTALRIARAATQRKKVVIFNGSYHGTFDGILGRVGHNHKTLPIAPGVVESMLDDLIILDYGDETALQHISEHHDIAAVVVEGIQSRQPTFQPKAFIQQLRKLTLQKDIALIFDEVLVGFRIHPKGAQGWYGVQADIATYGKIAGGGLPIGLVAGSSRFMDSTDGGQWQYGDDSVPANVNVTFFSGTFCKHPLALATAKAVLEKIIEKGPALQETLNRRTDAIAQELNHYFHSIHVPLKVLNCGSLFRFQYPGDLEILFYHLQYRGIFIWEGRNCFISTEHTEAEIQYIVRTLKECVLGLRDTGFLINKESNKTDEKLNLSPITTQLGFGEKTLPARNIRRTYPHGQAGTPYQPKTKNSASTSPLNKADIPPVEVQKRPTQTMDFSLYFFGNYDGNYQQEKYHTLLESARFADDNAFHALWLPERHFHDFGGLSPNPSVLSASLATITKTLHLRAGSVVLPLHHPVRVAEEWSVVDNLSNGRIGLGFGSGWHADDFALAPENYGHHRELTFERVETIRKLWKGEDFSLPNGSHKEIPIKLFPMPKQKELPIWMTIVNNPLTYVMAARAGAGILTNLMGQSIEQLAHNIAIYRQELANNGFDPRSGHVSVLLHTFVDNEETQAKEKAREPFYQYMLSSLGLLQNLAKAQGMEMDINQMSEEDRRFLLDRAYDRYVETSSLIGSPESCNKVVSQLSAIGVDEIASLVDFGLDSKTTLEGLTYLNTLKDQYQTQYPRNNTFTPGICEKPSLIEYPLTEAQKHIWVVANSGSGASPAYNEPLLIALKGAIQKEAIEKTLHTLVERHDSLRSTLSNDGNRRYCHNKIDFSVEHWDFSSDSNRQHEAILNTLTEAMYQPFDLSKGPLFRAGIATVQADLHYLVFIAHHIIIDGRSYDVILNEMSVLYDAHVQNLPAELPAPLSYENYHQWQNNKKNASKSDASKSYWLNRYKTLPPALDLPTDYPRPAVLPFDGARVHLAIPESIFTTLKHRAAKNNVTPTIMVFSAYALLLHQMSQQHDITIGIPVSVRPPNESAEHLVGFCLNMLPIRSNVHHHDSTDSFLKKTKDLLLDAYEQQHYLFSDLIQELKPERDASRSPLVQAIFNMEEVATPSFHSEESQHNATSELIFAPIKFTKYDITLNAIIQNNTLEIVLDYNTHLFSQASAKRFLERLKRCIHFFSLALEAPVTHLKLALPEETQLFKQWNQNPLKYEKQLSIHGLIESQVEKTPEAIAVSFKDESITYSELNTRANQLAHQLLSKGFVTGEKVAIFLERQLELPIALIAVLKCGGTYVPLDPNYPAERISLIIDDAKAQYVITQATRATQLPKNLTAQTLILEQETSKIKRRSKKNIASNIDAHAPAYLIYTSGSTGRPKGVMISHQNAASMLSWGKHYFSTNALKHTIASTSICFDLSIFELFLPLSCGCEIILVENALQLANHAAVKRATLINTVPSIMNQLLDMEGLPASISTVNLAGEPLKKSLVNRLFKRPFIKNVFNLYGPSECTTYSTVAAFEKNTEGNIHIGKPVNNTQAYILDNQLEPVPLRTEGELYLAGDAVATGYYGNVRMTAERFLPDAMAHTPGARMYRTGDKARFLPSGDIEYLGRMDHQVKLRGYRIELGEIEIALTEHSNVDDAVVIVYEDSNEKTLVAYIVSHSLHIKEQEKQEEQKDRLVESLTFSLKKKLPAYLVPSRICVLERLPLTPNGKIDRKALPEPEKIVQPKHEYTPPKTATEIAICDIWQHVLAMDNIGLHDDFFTLLGDSFKAIQIIQKINERFSIQLYLSHLIHAPSIYDLALQVDQLVNDDVHQVMSDLKDVDDETLRQLLLETE